MPIERSVQRSSPRPGNELRRSDGDSFDDYDYYETSKSHRDRFPLEPLQHFRAANIDQVVVVCSPLQPPFRPRLLDRYLAAASHEALFAVICLNKVVLGVPDTVAGYLSRYAALAGAVVETSTVTGEGIGGLRDCLAGRTSLFAGHSGVGKSSLLNALEPGLALRVGEVTRATAGQGKGRHTTSSARLVPLSSPHTFVVDSPGIRAFEVQGIDPAELAEHFSDIAALARGCLHRDCRHTTEPGCEVTLAATDDWFLRERLDSYRAILQELA